MPRSSKQNVIPRKEEKKSMTLGPLSSVQWRLKHTPTVQRGSGRQQSCPTQITKRSMAMSIRPPCGARATKSIFGIITPQPPEMWLNLAGRRTGVGGAVCVSAAPPSVRAGMRMSVRNSSHLRCDSFRSLVLIRLDDRGAAAVIIHFR